MAPRSELLRIHDMLQSISEIETVLKTVDYQEFTKTWVLRSGIERGVEIISEASRHLSPGMKAQYPHIRWQKIAGIGNVLRHDYQRIESEIVWQTVTNELPLLKTALLAMQASLSD